MNSVRLNSGHHFFKYNKLLKNRQNDVRYKKENCNF